LDKIFHALTSALLNKTFRIIFWLFIAWLILRVFVFQVMQVPTDSMNNTFMKGDRVLVDKWSYGARIPITPLSIPFMNEVFVDWISLPYLRLPGIMKVRRNDVIVFNLPGEKMLPVDQRSNYVKRCVGLPGDTILIKKGVLFVNGKKISEAKGVLYRYRAISIDGEEEDLFISSSDADLLAKSSSSVSRHITDSSYYNPGLFPHSSVIKWNADHFGPFYIPRKGDTVLLSEKTVALYKDIINDHEGTIFQQVAGQYFIDNDPVKTYTFKMDHYFVLGDNRYNSTDSRYFGCIPEDHLIGKVSFVIFSGSRSSSNR
jgi:signal peptidase I